MELPAYFETLMNRAPIPSSDISMYLREMRRTPSGPLVTSKLLAGKIQSSNEAQAIHAFEFLVAALESETEGSIEFRTEIGRYRFLNEIIRILSPKYLGNETSNTVKERAIKFLCDAAGLKKQRWFPSEHSKLLQVYQSLLDTGIIMKTPEEELATADAAEAELHKSIFDREENKAVLKKLLTSKDPNDLEAANRLIKNLVDEESKRNERRAELHSLIDRIDTSTTLLTQMLEQSTIDNELVDDLAVSCRNLRQQLGSTATETNDETTSLVQASENIETVLKLYEERKLTPVRPADPEMASAKLDILSSDPLPLDDNSKPLSAFSLADELLMGISEEFAVCDTTKIKPKTNPSSMADSENLLLNFDMEIKSECHRAGGDGRHNNIVGAGASVETDSSTTDKSPDTLNEIERMSRELMEEGLKHYSQGKVPAFISPAKKTEKTSLHQLQKNASLFTSGAEPTQKTTATAATTIQNSTLFPATSNNDTAFLDLDFLENFSSSRIDGKSATTPHPPSSSVTNKTNVSSNNNDLKAMSKSPRGSNTSNEDDYLLNLGDSPNQNNQTTTNNHNSLTLHDDSNSQKSKPESVLSSASLKESSSDTVKVNPAKLPNFCLNSVKDVDLEKIDLFDNMKPIELTLSFEDGTGDKAVEASVTFGKFPEFPDVVHVAVVAVTNRSSMDPMCNYVFQLLPPKGVQVKLLPPSCMELPPWKKSFLPPPVLNQVALVLTPSSATSPGMSSTSTKIRFILSYCLGEGETVLHNGQFDLPSHL